MKKGAKRNQIISELLHVTDEEFTDEELIHQLIATEVTKNADKDEHMTFGQRAADAVARFAGSWAFIFSFMRFGKWKRKTHCCSSKQICKWQFIVILKSGIKIL